MQKISARFRALTLPATVAALCLWFALDHRIQGEVTRAIYAGESGASPNDYALWAFWLDLLTRIWEQFPKVEVTTRLLLVKVMPIIAVVATGQVFARRASAWAGGQRVSRLLFAAVAFCPALIYSATLQANSSAVAVLLGLIVVDRLMRGSAGAWTGFLFGILLGLTQAAWAFFPVALLMTPSRADRIRLAGVALAVCAAALAGRGLVDHAIPMPKYTTWDELNVFALFGLNRVMLSSTLVEPLIAWSLGLGTTAAAVAWLWPDAKKGGQSQRLCFGAICVLLWTLLVPGMQAQSAAMALPFLMILGASSPRGFAAYAGLACMLALEAHYVLHMDAFANENESFFGFNPLWRTTPVVLACVASKVTILVALILDLRGFWRTTARSAVATHPITFKSLSERLVAMARLAPNPFPLRAIDGVFLLAALAICASLSFHDLGVRSLPASALAVETAYRVERTKAGAPIRAIWAMMDDQGASVEIRCAGDDDWQFSDFYSFNAYQWSYKRLARPCADSFDLKLKPWNEAGRLFELIFDVGVGAPLKDVQLCSGNGQCLPMAATPLGDDWHGSSMPTRQDGGIYDEAFNTLNGIRMLRGIPATSLQTVHPFLGRALITASMRVWGISPFGWRFPGALAGALLPLAGFFLARELFGKRSAAWLATLLVGLDTCRLALSQVATVDSQMTVWIILGYLFLYRFAHSRLVQARGGRLVLFAAGTALGAAAATKWVGMFALACAIAVVASVVIAERLAAVPGEGGPRRRFSTEVLAAAVALVVIPFVIYIAAYIPFLPPSSVNGAASTIVAHQAQMFQIHSDSSPYNLYSSQFLWWPFVETPAATHFGHGVPAGTTGASFIFGNPIIWWAILPALALVLCRRQMRGELPLAFIAVAFAAQFLPWALVYRATYIYHFASAATLGTVLIAGILSRGETWSIRLRWPYVTAAAVAFVLFMPLVKGVPISNQRHESLRWFSTWFQLSDPMGRFELRPR